MPENEREIIKLILQAIKNVIKTVISMIPVSSVKLS